MATFNKIINRVVNLDNNIFSLNYDKNDTIQGIYKFFFITLYDNLYKNKFEYIETTLTNFYFSVKTTERNNFFDLFCKIQRTYHILNNFVRKYKHKKTKLIVDTDLQLNKINENEPNVICIYHVNSKYLFKMEDLLKLVYMSLINCFSFFSEPISIKNPYNNIPFGKSVLYHIYINLVSNTKIKFIKPEHLDVFLKFKDCNFNMTKFVNNYEYILREYAIKNCIHNSTKNVIIDEIKEMVSLFNNNFSHENKKIQISNEFPEDILIRIMKPYLYLNLVSCYSLVQKNKIEARKNLHKKLCEFQKFNPQFGRKLIKLKDIIENGKIKKIKSHIEFNTKHQKFTTYEIHNFMNNHLDYKYESYEYEESDEEPQLPLNNSLHEENEEEVEEEEEEEEEDLEVEDEEVVEEDETDEEDYEDCYDNDSIS
jgi:hypothetical protein